MRILLPVFLAGILIPLDAQEVSYHHQYSIEDGLAQRTVRQILRDGAGRFWIRYDQNIQLYDGKNFLDLESPEIFNVALVKSISSIAKGDVVIQLVNGQNWLVLQQGLKFQLLDSINLDYERIIDSEDALYKVSFDSTSDESIITEFSDGVFNTLAKINHPFPIRNIVRSSSHFYFLDNEKNLLYQAGDSQIPAIIKPEVDQIIGKQEEFLWVRVEDSLFKYDEVGNSFFQDSLRFSRVELRHDKLGRTVIGFSNHSLRITKAILFENGKSSDYSSFCTSKELNTINDFFSEDFRRQLLTGSYNGLHYFHFSEHIKTYLADNNQEGSFGKVTWWIIQRKDGDIYFALESPRVYSLNTEDELNIVNVPNKFPGRNPSNFYAYYLEERDALMSFVIVDGKNYLQFFDFENSVDTVQARGRYYDYSALGPNNLLMAGRIGQSNGKASIGIIDLELKKIVSEQIIEGAGARFFCLKSGPEDSWILGSDQGVFQIEFPKPLDLTNYTIEKIIDIPALDLIVDNDTIILASYGKGIYKINLDGEIVSHLDRTKGLVDDIVLSLAKDEKENVWLSTLGGVNLVDSKFQIVKSFRRLNGLASNEMNHQSILVDNKQRAYFGGLNGLTVILPSVLESHAASSSLVLKSIDFKREEENVSIDVSSSEDLKIPYYTDKVTLNAEIFDYFKNSVIHDRRYQYIFKDRLTNEPLFLKDESIELNNVPKGDFNIDWIPPPTLLKSEYTQNSISLYRETFWDKFGLGILLSVCTISLLFYLGFLLIRRRIEQQKIARERQKVKMNTLQLRALQSQMNPHFIYNALGSIQYYIQREESDLAEEYLTDFALLMRHILDSASVDRINLSKEIELLELYIRLEQIRLDHKFVYSIKTDSHLDQEVKIPPMILQPFVENAINHGIVHRHDEKGELRLQFIEEDGLIRCIIEDNGVGRKKSVALRTKKHNPKAMGIIQERQELMNKISEQNITIQIDDYSQTDDLFPGTRVVVDF